MKKFFAVLSVLVLMVSLCACTKQESVKAEAPEQMTMTESLGNVKLQPIKDIEKPELVPVANKVSEPKWEEGWFEIIAPNGRHFDMPKDGCIISTKGNRCLLQLVGDGLEIWVCDQEDGMIKISGKQKVVDYTVAYETIYWLNLDREVWAAKWYNNNEPYLFCEDAIAVSPFADEAQGAVVTWDRANIDYGYGLPIYSPYGE